jgi:hypothetical protein
MLKVDIAIVVTHPILSTRDIMPIFDIKATAEHSANIPRISPSGKEYCNFRESYVRYDVVPEMLKGINHDIIIHDVNIYFESKVKDRQKLEVFLQSGGNVTYEVYLEEILDKNIFELSPRILGECADLGIPLCLSMLMASEKIVSENTDYKGLDFVTISVEQLIPLFVDNAYTHNFNNGIVYYSHKIPLNGDTYLENEIDRAITVYKKQAVDMFLSAKKVWCKIKLCTKTYYHYAFTLPSEICKLCAELNIGIMVCL